MPAGVPKGSLVVHVRSFLAHDGNPVVLRPSTIAFIASVSSSVANQRHRTTAKRPILAHRNDSSVSLNTIASGISAVSDASTDATTLQHSRSGFRQP